MSDTPQRCAWCSKVMPPAQSATAHDTRSYCSRACAGAHHKARFGPNLAEVEARRAAAGRGPKGCCSIEEYLAAGGQIIRGDAAAAFSRNGPLPVRPKGNEWNRGWVRK